MIRTLPFEAVFADESGGNIKTPQSEYQNSGQFAVVDQGKSLIAGYVNDDSRLCGNGRSAIVFGDHTRCIKYIDFPFCMGADGVKVLRPKIDANLKYLYYYLKQIKLPDAGYDRHYKYLKRTEVLLPSLPEQTRIATILDQADALRLKRREAIAKLDSLKQSIFIDMFGDPITNPKGWETNSLGNLCTISGEYGAGLSATEYDSSIPRYVRITDITEGGYLTNDAVSPLGSPKDWKGYLLQKGDILFARSGATVGKTYMYRESDGDCVFAGYLIRFRPDSLILMPEYLFHFTRTVAYNSWVALRQNVVAQPNINAKQYGNELVLPIPPITLQREFTQRIDFLEKQRAIQLEQSAELDRLFASIQHRAFHGEL